MNHLLRTSVLFMLTVSITGLIPLTSFADTRTRDVSSFHGISSGGSYRVLVTLGSKESLRLEGDSDDIDRIETQVENGILLIRNKSKTGWSWNSGNVTIYITAKSLDKLSVSGSGSMDVTGDVKAGELTTVVSGSGKLRLTATATSFNAVLSGSGSAEISGSSHAGNIVVSGSGNFRGDNFRMDDTSVKISGSGGVRVRCESNLRAAISGSGSVRYSGNAAVSVKKSGSGSVSKI